MRKITFLLLILFSLNIDLSAQRPFAYYFNAKVLDANNINAPLTNYGNMEYSRLLPCEYESCYFEGAYWYHFQREVIVYDHGLFFTGKINNVKYVAESVWSSLFTPGPILGDKPARLANPSDSLRYRVYKISPDDRLSVDLKEWPADLGAPSTENNKPMLYADQTIWTVYNALDTNRRIWQGSQRAKYPVTPLEVRQTAYAYKTDKTNPDNYLNDVAFFEWEIINKGESRIDSAVIGLWTDIDFYGENDFPAVDTSLQLGYCWSNYRAKDEWGLLYDSSKIPAVGYAMLYGPSVPSPGDTAVFRGSRKINFRNLPLSSFWGFLEDSYPEPSPYGPAYQMETTWNIAHGFDKLGNKITDPLTGVPTSFRYAGDPVTNTGWLGNKIGTAGGAGFYMFSGNFTLAPKDTQWVMFALLAARGGDNLKSITELRKRADYLRSMKYGDLVKTSELEYRPGDNYPKDFDLMQNFPNPFNSFTRIIYTLKERGNIKIELFNLLGEKIRTLFEGTQNSGYNELILSSGSLPSGVYFYRLSSAAEGGSLTKKLILLK